MNNTELNTLIKIIKQVAHNECQQMLKNANVASNYFASVVGINSDGTCNVLLAGGDTPYTNLLNKTGETLNVGDSVLIEALSGNIGNSYIKIKQGI